MSLIFRIAELRQSFQCMGALANEFVNHVDRDRLTRLANDLDSMLDRGGRRWEIEKDKPINTILSDGRHEVGKDWGKSLKGQFSFLWELNRDPQDRKFVELVDNASCLISFVEVGENGEETLKSSFHFDVSKEGGFVGPKFHVQRPDNETMIPIPRIPSLIFHPVDCMDFMLGELFPRRWFSLDGRKINDISRLRKNQRARMKHLLRYLVDHVETNNAQTIIQSMKHAQPPRDLFV